MKNKFKTQTNRAVFKITEVYKQIKLETQIMDFIDYDSHNEFFVKVTKNNI